MTDNKQQYVALDADFSDDNFSDDNFSDDGLSEDGSSDDGFSGYTDTKHPKQSPPLQDLDGESSENERTRLEYIKRVIDEVFASPENPVKAKKKDVPSNEEALQSTTAPVDQDVMGKAARMWMKRLSELWMKSSG